MALACGCSVARVTIMGTTMERVRWQSVHGGECSDCGAIANGYHHVGCPAEECPACGRTARGCGCERLAAAGRDVRADGTERPTPYEVEFGAGGVESDA